MEPLGYIASHHSLNLISLWWMGLLVTKAETLKSYQCLSKVVKCFRRLVVICKTFRKTSQEMHCTRKCNISLVGKTNLRRKTVMLYHYFSVLFGNIFGCPSAWSILLLLALYDCLGQATTQTQWDTAATDALGQLEWGLSLDSISCTLPLFMSCLHLESYFQLTNPM